jgi:hypothetical protein
MKNKYPIETKYTTKNMREIKFINDGFYTSFNAKYNSKDINIAPIQLYEFNQKKDFFMNLINQYREINKITK